MIRSLRLQLHLLNAWLVDQLIPRSHATYRLRVWREESTAIDGVRQDLIRYFTEALDDARKRLRQGFEDSLSPFSAPASDPAANFPALLHRVTLQGYLGETLAVVAVEHWGAHGYTDWKVPALLFRYHEVEFQHLEIINERLDTGDAHDADDSSELRPGRTGDDGLAFRVDDANSITDVLTLEAKCLSQHNSKKLEEAHKKLAAGSLRPTGIHELISLLSEYDTPSAQRWQEALLKLWRGGYRSATRYDGVVYACGNMPAQNGRLAWLPIHSPHPSYTLSRGLEGMEFHFADLPSLVDTLYRGASDG
jgi:hypothetical protein